MELKEFNENIYNEYLSLENLESLASPLLVSSKEYLKKVKENPIMYIGQETYGWVNFKGDTIYSLDNIEKCYDEFLMKRNTSKTIYWQFIKKILDVDYDKLYENIVWTNTVLIGSRYSKGAPIMNNKLKELSLKNLLFLYEYFKPEYVINVSGIYDPYYDITDAFLKKIGLNIESPTKENPIVIKDEYMWSYHPNYLRKSGNEAKVLKKIKELY